MIPTCSPTGVIPVNLTAANATATAKHGVEALHYRIGGAGEQIIATPEGSGGQAQRSITSGSEGRIPLEYWGDFTNDPAAGRSTTALPRCSWTRRGLRWRSATGPATQCS